MPNEAVALKKKARMAGTLYVLMVILGFYGIMYVPSQVLVIGNAPSTFDNLLQNEFLFRTAIFTHLLNTVVFTMMVLIFYQMFSGVHRYLSLLMVALVILHLSFEFGSEAMNYTALLIAKGQFLPSLELLQRQEWVYLFLRTAKFGSVGLAIAFWGLWMIPLGLLVYKSRFIPRALGILLIAGGTAYIVDGMYFILFPGSGGLFKSAMLLVSAIAEISFVCWLLIKGVQFPNKDTT